ncbi:MAG: 30S ribosomal protein S24e [Euryarchaeota archaeon]|nr:30S ribosomal protein S24e [Euryarchaeota archaeon]
MKIEVVTDKENVLLNRRDIIFRVIPEGEVCSRENVKNRLVALLDTKSEQLILDRMNAQYGMQQIIGYARLYEDVKNALAIEPDYMIARNAMKKSDEG